MNDWLPIETAPKDGTVILGYTESDSGYSGRGYCIMKWAPELGEKTSYVWFDPEHETPQCPSHWMPLPEPPTSLSRMSEESLARDGSRQALDELMRRQEEGAARQRRALGGLAGTPRPERS